MSQSTLRLAVLGAPEATGPVRTAATGAGARLVDPAAADAVVAVGDAAVREAAVVGDGGPADGDPPVTDIPVLPVDDGSRRIAAFDVAFLTAEPARISEHTLRFTGDEATSFRADGAVVATPLGSRGYAGSAGGPSVSPDGGIPVVPVAPRATRPGLASPAASVRTTSRR